MFGPLIIDEGPSLSTTAGRTVAQLMLVWHHLYFLTTSVPLTILLTLVKLVCSAARWIQVHMGTNQGLGGCIEA